MTWQEAAIVALLTASALLPLAGLANLYWASRDTVKRLSAGKDPRNPNTNEWLVVDTMKVVREDIAFRPSRVLRDFALIGGGVLCGAVGGIWSLLL